MTETTFAPTDEQQEALRLFATGKSLAIEAGAGAGKTSTLKLLAESTPRRGQYIAFNKAIVEEAKLKMPSSVAASTAHSLAYRNIVSRNKWMADRLRHSARMKSTEIASRLRIEQMNITLQDGSFRRLHASYLAGVAMRGVIRFCQSADLEPDASHVPYIDGIDLPPGARDNNRIVAKALVAPMRRAWADITDPDGTLPFRHDHYLKLWHLSGPKINADYILFDEAQDANPVLVDIVRQQTHAQLVWVGDSNQQIYSFTGAINALASVGAEQTATLSQSFRFGPAIADIANRCLEGLKAPLRLTGTDTIPSRVAELETSPDGSVILSRTNAAAVRELLAQRSAGKRGPPGRRRPRGHRLRQGRPRPHGARLHSHPELACFGSWGEVQTYVEQDEQGGDLRLLVSLIDDFGVRRSSTRSSGCPAKRTPTSSSPPRTRPRGASGTRSSSPPTSPPSRATKNSGSSTSPAPAPSSTSTSPRSPTSPKAPSRRSTSTPRPSRSRRSRPTSPAPTASPTAATCRSTGTRERHGAAPDSPPRSPKTSPAAPASSTSGATASSSASITTHGRPWKPPPPSTATAASASSASTPTRAT
jgi:hypothetical protein